MNKSDLIQAVSKTTGLSRNEVTAATNAFISAISEALSRNERVTLTGFGTFENTKRRARAGVNPRTGAAIKIPEMVLPRFRAGKALRNRIR